MKKEKHYHYTKFNPEIIQEASSKFISTLNKDQKIHCSFEVKFDGEKWTYESEDEFVADYRRNTLSATYHKFTTDSSSFVVYFNDVCTDISVQAKHRGEIESVFEIFERNLSLSKLPEKVKEQKKTKIFIGHGRSPQWRDLKDHLHDKHGYDIEAYEIGARAGHTIRDILGEMLDSSSFALLIFTGEDEDKEGKLHARENVIHELGLFQGKLGFSKSVVLLEEGTHEFSNIHGIHQIRYSKGNIRETFGEILATLRREHV